VTRDELVQLCWDGRIVGDDVINRSISLVRQLAESAGGFEIETVPRTGYRLIETARTRFGPKKRWVIGGAALLAFAAVGVVAFFERSGADRRATLDVVVLPFTTDSADGSSRQLASDAHDSVVRMLTESGLSVTTSNNASADLVVSGSVSSNPQSASAVVRVEDLPRKAMIFTRRLQSDRAHAGDLPDRVGANLAASLSWTGQLIRLDERHPADPVFLVQLLEQVSVDQFEGLQPYEFARRNAPAAPDSAAAQIVLAIDTGVSLGALAPEDRPAALAVGRQAADRAQRLAPDFGDVYCPWCILHSPLHFAACEDHLRAGLAADRDAPFVPAFLTDLLNNVGRTDEAFRFATLSLAADQYVPRKISRMILMEEATGDTEAAEARYRDAERLWPNFGSVFWDRLWGIVQRGDLDGIERFEQEVGARNLPQGYVSVAPLADAVRARSLQRVTAACPSGAEDFRAVECMLAFNRLGAIDQAYSVAQKLYPSRRGRTAAEEQALWLAEPFSTDTVYLTVPATAPLRRDPRFLVLAANLGLLDYWRSGRLPDFCTKAHEPVCAKFRHG
jgi:hypothetical protein